jgi:competence protein ComEC
MLLWNPNWLLNISFQLSFLATLGVVVVAPVLLDWMKVVPKIIKEDLAVTLAAQLLVLPIIAYNFYQISLVGILVNSLILWSIPIVMISGFIALGMGIINLFLGQIAGLVSGILLTYFVYLVQIFAKIPGANLKIGETSLLVWTGYYFFMASFIWGLGVKKKLQTHID